MGVVNLDNNKLDSGKVEKEELDRMATISDMETDDEGCWFQDGMDLRGHS